MLFHEQRLQMIESSDLGRLTENKIRETTDAQQKRTTQKPKYTNNIKGKGIRQEQIKAEELPRCWRQLLEKMKKLRKCFTP